MPDSIRSARGRRAARWLSSATVAVLTVTAIVSGSDSAGADAVPQPIPDGIYLESPWSEPGSIVWVDFVGTTTECGDGQTGITRSWAFVDSEGSTPLDPAHGGSLGSFAVARGVALIDQGTGQPLGSTGPVSGELELTCTPTAGGTPATVSMPLTVRSTPPATIYHSPTAWTWYTPDDMTAGGAVVTVNALGFEPGEPTTVSLVNRTMWEANLGDFTGAIAGPATATADGEGSVTAQMTVPVGWAIDDDLDVTIAGASSRYLLISGAGTPAFGDASIEIANTDAAFPSGLVSVSAGGFEPGETVQIALHSATAAALPLGTLTANSAGTIAGNVTLPNEVAPGAYRLWAGAKTTGYLLLNAPLTVVEPPISDRIFGPDRFSTSAAVAQQFDSAVTVYVANGRNYPDALSAAPAAAYADGPLLLTEFASLPTVIADEIVRLDPDRIVVVGGTAVVSTSVEAELEALQLGDQVERIAGADRYETSRLVSADAFTTAPTAFIATGTNFPDALAASAAAGHYAGPVILTNGSATSIDTDTLALLDTLNTTEVLLAGGTAVVSPGIEASLNTVFGDVNVRRLAGADRYGTSVAINTDTFATSTTVYLAVGTGYADALSGAALAGKNDAPLFVVPGTCVPQAVLDAIIDLGATDVVLFGGTAALTAAVANLTSCG